MRLSQNRYVLPTRGHRAVKRFFELLNEQDASLTDVAAQAGVHEATAFKWRRDRSPAVDNLEAALNVLGYELQVRRRRCPPDPR